MHRGTIQFLWNRLPVYQEWSGGVALGDEDHSHGNGHDSHHQGALHFEAMSLPKHRQVIQNCEQMQRVMAKIF